MRQLIDYLLSDAKRMNVPCNCIVFTHSPVFLMTRTTKHAALLYIAIVSYFSHAICCQFDLCTCFTQPTCAECPAQDYVIGETCWSLVWLRCHATTAMMCTCGFSGDRHILFVSKTQNSKSNPGHNSKNNKQTLFFTEFSDPSRSTEPIRCLRCSFDS